MFIKFTLPGLLFCLVLYFLFHENAKSPQDELPGIWVSKSEVGVIRLSLKKNKLFNCTIFDATTNEKFAFNGKWKVLGTSATIKTSEPIDAFLIAKTFKNKEIFNHRIVRISEEMVELFRKGETKSILFKKLPNRIL